MRDLQCPCGITLTGADDEEELLSLGLERADNHHPGEAIPTTSFATTSRLKRWMPGRSHER